MNHPISDKLLDRLSVLAEKRNTDVDTLLARMIDDEEAQSWPTDVLKQFSALTRDLFCVLDRNGALEFVSNSWKPVLSYGKEALLKVPLSSFLHPDDAPLVDQVLFDLRHERTPENVEVRFRHADGSYLWLSWKTIISDDGRFISTLRDITQDKIYIEELTLQRKQASDLLERYQGLVNSQIDLVCRFTPDTVLTFVNDAYCNHFGKSRNELVGKSYLGLINADEIPFVLNRIEELKRDPSPGVSVTSGVTSEDRHAWVQWMDYGILDEEGNVVEIQAVGRDITALYEAQEETRRVNEVLQTVLDQIPLMIGLFDADGQVEFVNRSWQELLGWTLEEIQAHPNIIEAYYPDSEYREEALSYMRLHNSGWRDFKTKTKSGGEVEASWLNIHLSDGRMIGIGQNLHDRRQLEEERLRNRQLEHELEKERALADLRERFASIISHEFRTPLTIIQTSVSFVEHYFEQLDRDRVHKKLKSVKQQVEYMVGLMEDVLTLSRNNYRGVGFRPRTVELVELFEQIVEDIKVLDADQHTFNMTLSPTLPDHVFVDPRIITHILTNLLSNAIKYSPVGSQVELQVLTPGQDLMFSVKDEGYGIPPDEQGQIFEPFQRASNAYQVQGTGLGLAIVRQNVEAHGGSIDLESDLDKGTTFTVRIPLITNADLDQVQAGV